MAEPPGHLYKDRSGLPSASESPVPCFTGSHALSPPCWESLLQPHSQTWLLPTSPQPGPRAPQSFPSHPRAGGNTYAWREPVWAPGIELRKPQGARKWPPPQTGASAQCGTTAHHPGRAGRGDPGPTGQRPLPGQTRPSLPVPWAWVRATPGAQEHPLSESDPGGLQTHLVRKPCRNYDVSRPGRALCSLPLGLR